MDTRFGNHDFFFSFPLLSRLDQAAILNPANDELDDPVTPFSTDELLIDPARFSPSTFLPRFLIESFSSTDSLTAGMRSTGPSTSESDFSVVVRSFSRRSASPKIPPR